MPDITIKNFEVVSTLVFVKAQCIYVYSHVYCTKPINKLPTQQLVHVCQQHFRTDTYFNVSVVVC